MAVLNRVLVVNAGSSSLKLRVLDAAASVVASADLPAPRGAADTAAVKDAIGSFGNVDAAGHRIVHGGTLYRAPVRIDPGVRQRMAALLRHRVPRHHP